MKKNYGASLHNILTIKPPQKEDGSPGRYRLKLASDAHGEWKEFSKLVEHDMRDGERFEFIRDWAGKLPGAAARVVGLLHCAIHAQGEPWKHSVERATMESALTLMAILAQHAIQAFEVMAMNPDIEKAKKIFAWIQTKSVPFFTLRNCHRDLQGTFKRVDELKPGLEVLTERSIIRQSMRKVNKIGRSSIAYDVNPQLLEGGNL